MPEPLRRAISSGDAQDVFRAATSDAARSTASTRSTRALRPLAPDVLADAVEAQNAAFGAERSARRASAALARGAAAVVTGQQVGLFLGPLYTVYKAATAIRVARALARGDAAARSCRSSGCRPKTTTSPEIASCAYRVR